MLDYLFHSHFEAWRAQRNALRLYKRYLKASSKIADQGRYMPYDWGQLPKSRSMIWMAYGLLFDEFSHEIANSLNQMTRCTHQLRAWDQVLSPLTDKQKLDAVVEFIEPLATVALSLPYVVRSRFVFATAHLCHQANRSRQGKSWKDDLKLDKDIKFKDACKVTSGWQAFASLRLSG
jgi:hypothetical protein